jgi:hypothetical protein
MSVISILRRLISRVDKKEGLPDPAQRNLSDLDKKVEMILAQRMATKKERGMAILSHSPLVGTELLLPDAHVLSY